MQRLCYEILHKYKNQPKNENLILTEDILLKK